MNKKSTEIENELNQTTNRLDELTEMRDGIKTNLENLQQDFIDRKTSLDELQAEQNKLTTLDSSIKALEAKQDELHDAFQKASLSETRQILLEKAKVIAIEAETAFNEYVETRNEFDILIGNCAAAMVDKIALFRSKQREYRSTVKQIEGKSTGASGQIYKELRQIGMTDTAGNLAATEFESFPPVEFGEVIAIAERLTANKRERAAREASA
jgi:chromosome segregation ATPase